MARSAPAPNLETIIPRQFGEWKIVPSVGLVTPTDVGYVEPDQLSQIYSQEVARGYADRNGNMVMLLVAYGPVQNYRLKSHMPEMCYNAAGFRVSKKSVSELSYRDGAQPLTFSRLIAAK